MNNKAAIYTAGLMLVLLFACCANANAQAPQNETTLQTERRTTTSSPTATWLRARTNSVKMVDFYLREGDLVFGKVVSEEKNMITIERLEESKIVVATYSKREVDSRTMHIRNVPEYKYYLDLAEYFSGRTWDFRDDPDDFIQAIRCYEKAKKSLTQSQKQDTEKIEQIDQNLEKLHADRQVWEREVQSRARLKKLEFEATIETRIKELESKVSENSQQLKKDEADVKDDYNKLTENISEINRNFARQLDALAERVQFNRSLMDRTSPYYPRYPYTPNYYYRPDRRGNNRKY